MVTVWGAVVVVVPPTIVDVVDVGDVDVVVVVAPGSVVVVVDVNRENVGTVDVGDPGETTFAAPIAATLPTSTTAPPHAMNRRTGEPAWRCARLECRATKVVPHQRAV
jgi:hypothetical protein